MGVRAILTVHDGAEHARFYAQWASPHYQIRHLADLIHHHDSTGQPLTMSALRAYTSAYPGRLPDEDITDSASYTDPHEGWDLDHRYRLQLDPGTGAFRYQVADHNRSRGYGPPFTVTRVLASRAQLYTAAAESCRRQALQHIRYPGEPDPQWWHSRAQDYRQRVTDANPITWPDDPPLDAVARGDISAAARRALAEHWPADTAHVDVRGDRVIRVDGPAGWGHRPVALAIALAVGTWIGRTQAVHVEPADTGRVLLTLRAHNVGGDQPQVSGATT